MKKLLFLLPLLFIGTAHSDTRTAQEPYFCIIATGVVDRTRSYGDKLNDNFTIASASISANTSAISGNASAVASATATLTTNLSSTATVLAQVRIDTGTLQSATGTLSGIQFQLRTDTGTLQIATSALASIQAQLRIDTGTLQTRLDAVAVATGTIEGGGGGAITNSTKPFTFSGSGSPYTAKFTSAAMASYALGRTTWNIVDIQVGFNFKCSTTNQSMNFSTFSVIVATRPATQVSGIDLSPIHSSSFTIGGGDINTRSPWETDPVTPDTITRILAFQRLYLWCDTMATAGDRPEGWWVKIRYWEEP